MEKEIILISTVICPDCGCQKEEKMPVDACQYFYKCEHCKSMLKPKKGHCCIFCSYGTIPCPSIQGYKHE
ncbi:MAG TPA: GDCCVxC domain-containing (seleno)protein [Candidatus Wujingus californicus]|uniref:GDCCVxC domain-containing (seleno)protein n=1 Tax=Candidatus Wujingus californicus TaxID=3367618 RepID=UPI0040268928